MKGERLRKKYNKRKQVVQTRNTDLNKTVKKWNKGEFYINDNIRLESAG